MSIIIDFEHIVVTDDSTPVKSVVHIERDDDLKVKMHKGGDADAEHAGRGIVVVVLDGAESGFECVKIQPGPDHDLEEALLEVT